MATIKDIADKAGVSMMTVSRTFNNPEVVKDEVRERILKIAKELNYVPNQAARSLANNKTGVVQIVTDLKPDSYYFTQLFASTAHYLSEHGYSIMINQHCARDYQYDGAIFMGLSPGEDQTIYETIKKPFVLFGKSQLPIDWVDIDNIEGTYQVTNHLISKGHKRIGFIGIEKDEPFIVERFIGFKKAMDEHGLFIDTDAVFQVHHSAEGVRNIGDKAIAMKGITAYVCETDFLAYSLIDYTKERGMSIPEDLSVVGFDGLLFNKIASPKITTVRQPVYEIGIEIAKALIKRMQNKEMPKQSILIPTVFENGGSVKDITN